MHLECTQTNTAVRGIHACMYSGNSIIQTPLAMGVWMCVRITEIVQITKTNTLLL